MTSLRLVWPIGWLFVMLSAACGVFSFGTPVDATDAGAVDECEKAKPGENYSRQFCWDSRSTSDTPSCGPSSSGNWSKSDVDGTWGISIAPQNSGGTSTCNLSVPPEVKNQNKEIVVRIEHQRTIPNFKEMNDVKAAVNIEFRLYAGMTAPNAAWQTSSRDFVTEELSLSAGKDYPSIKPSLVVKSLTQNPSLFAWKIRHLSIWVKNE